MKAVNLNVRAFVLLLIVVIAVAAYIVVQRRNVAVEAEHPEAEPFEVELTRLRTDAPAVLLTECTNTIIGLNRIISTTLDDHADDVSAWHAEVTAEFVNKIGGVERTNMPMVFEKRGDRHTGHAILICSPDYALIIKNRH